MTKPYTWTTPILLGTGLRGSINGSLAELWRQCRTNRDFWAIGLTMTNVGADRINLVLWLFWSRLRIA